MREQADFKLEGKIVDRVYLGDNLPILEALKKAPTVCGQVRLVYIDPPYGTGQNFIVSSERRTTVSRPAKGQTAYHDTLTGKEYLDFLFPRLVLLRDLMAADGSIYVHIDIKIGHYVKVLMDEIFGAKNFRSDITRIKCNPKNFPRRAYGNVKDMILFYTKTNRYIWNPPRLSFTEEQLRRLFPRIDSLGRRYTTTPLHAPGETKNGPTGAEWKGLRPPPGRHWRYVPEVLTKLDEAGLIEWSARGNPRKKLYAEEAQTVGQCLQDVWEFKDPVYPRYPTEKNLEMLKVIIEASSNPGDLVLDCFCGSGTTLVAAQQLGRHWIGIDTSELAIEICGNRLNSPLQYDLFPERD